MDTAENAPLSLPNLVQEPNTHSLSVNTVSVCFEIMCSKGEKCGKGKGKRLPRFKLDTNKG